MEDTNNLTIIGRIVKDAELKQSEYPICYFTIAVNRSKKNKEGQREGEASFFDINVFGKYAEIMVERLKKSVMVCITGELKQERWEDKQQQKRSHVVITADKIQIVGGNNAQ
jgi:single-strand DNA-binding protein